MAFANHDNAERWDCRNPQRIGRNAQHLKGCVQNSDPEAMLAEACRSNPEVSNHALREYKQYEGREAARGETAS